MAENQDREKDKEKEQEEKKSSDEVEAGEGVEAGETAGESPIVDEDKPKKSIFSFRLVVGVGIIVLVLFFVFYKVTNVSIKKGGAETVVSTTRVPSNPTPFAPTTSPTLKEAQEKEIELMKEKGQLFLSTDFGGELESESDEEQKKKEEKKKEQFKKPDEKKQPKPARTVSSTPPPAPPAVAVKPMTKEEALKERLWADYLTQQIGLGGFVPVGGGGGGAGGGELQTSGNGTVRVVGQFGQPEQTVQNNELSQIINTYGTQLAFFRYEPYCFVPAVVEVGGDTLPGTGNVVVARVTRSACGVPANSRLVGQPVFVPYRNRASIRFTRIKTPDGAVYAILGDAYMADESPGVASVIVHNDRKRAIFQSVSKGVAAAADAASQEPTDEKCYYMDEGVVVCDEDQKQPKPSKVFLREFSANMAENTDVFFPNVVQVPKVVKIEKGLPIKVLLLEPSMAQSSYQSNTSNIVPVPTNTSR